MASATATGTMHLANKEILVNPTSEQPIRSRVRRVLGPVWTTRLLCLLRGRGLPRWGNLRRLKPFSQCHGWDRGTPLDRYYVDRFFERNRAQSPATSWRSTGTSTPTDTATTCELFTASTSIPNLNRPSFAILRIARTSFHRRPTTASCCPARFTTSASWRRCLTNVLRVVKPGGAILATVRAWCGSTRKDRFLASHAGRLARIARGNTWPDCEVVVEGEGNCLAAMAFNLGLALEELKRKELDHHDGLFPVVTTIYCRKPAAPGGKSEAE